MSAHSYAITLDRVFRNGFLNIADPGASGTFGIINKGEAHCEVVTAGAESRVLPTASGFGLGTKLRVFFKTAGGNLTITGSNQTVVLAVAGDTVEFVVGISGTTKAWKLASDSRLAVGELQAGIQNGAVAATTETATITAAQVLGGFILGTPVSAATYTLPTAALLVAAINGLGTARVGQIIRLTIFNAGADGDDITVAAGGGATDEGRLTVEGAHGRDFVITITNVTASTEAYVLYGIGTLAGEGV